MLRTRRLVPLVLVAALGATALTGCRSEPWVAAYTAGRTVTEKDVDAIVDDARAKADELNRSNRRAIDPMTGEAVQPAKAPNRALVLQTMLANDIYRQLFAKRQLTPVEARAAAQFASSEGFPLDSRYGTARVEMYGYLVAYIRSLQPTQPTEAELRDVYRRARVAGAEWAKEPFEQVVDEQINVEAVQVAYAGVPPLTEAVNGAHVKLNPRYRGLEIPLLPFNDTALISAVGVPLAPAAHGA